MLKFINELTKRILKGGEITFTEALRLSEIRKQKDMVFLFGFANQIREKFQGSIVDLCAIVNAVKIVSFAANPHITGQK